MKDYLINMSGVYSEELFRPDGAESADLTGFEGTVCYCSPESEAAIRARLRDIPISATHWIDTGDYHYLTKFFLERIDEPFQLALFDHHPDRQESAFGGDLLSCGGWVESSLRDCPLLRNVFTVGTEDGSRLVPGLPVYFSVDLDILAPAWFRTDWSQGKMSLPELHGSISAIFRTHRVLGMDVCGGITRAKGASDCDLSTNKRVRETFLGKY